MAERDHIEGRFGCERARQPAKSFRAEHLVDDAQTIRPLGMAERRFMVEASRMGDEESCHAKDLFALNLYGCRRFRKTSSAAHLRVQSLNPLRLVR
jgi:hypothetical protein